MSESPLVSVGRKTSSVVQRAAVNWKSVVHKAVNDEESPFCCCRVPTETKVVRKNLSALPHKLWTVKHSGNVELVNGLIVVVE